MSTQSTPSFNAIDVQTATAALRRAAALARKIAIDTNTHLVVIRNGKLVRIPAKKLRQKQKEN